MELRIPMTGHDSQQPASAAALASPAALAAGTARIVPTLR